MKFAEILHPVAVYNLTASGSKSAMEAVETLSSSTVVISPLAPAVAAMNSVSKLSEAESPATKG